MIVVDHGVTGDLKPKLAIECFTLCWNAIYQTVLTLALN